MTTSFNRFDRAQQFRNMFKTLNANKMPSRNMFLSKERGADKAALTPTTAPFRLITQAMRKAYTPDSFVIWRNLSVQPEIFNALSDTVFYPVEAMGALYASQGAEQVLLEAGEENGSPRTVCSFAKSISGGVQLDIFPTPNLLITVSKGCEGLSNVYAQAGQHYKAPMFTIHVPYDAPKAECLPYVEAQVRESVQLVEKLKGETLDSDRLRKTLKTAEATFRIFRETIGLRSRYPFLDPLSVYQSLTIGTSPFYGKQALLDYAQAMVAGYKKRLQSDPSVHRQPERRLMWMFLTPYFPNDLIEYIEQDGRFRFVWDDISTLEFKKIDLENPYRSTALTMTISRESVSVQKLFKIRMENIRRHRIDGVIMWGMPYCGIYHFQYPILQRMFNEQGVPSLILDACCVDSRTYNTGQIRTRVDAFCENLLKRPRRWPDVAIDDFQESGKEAVA